MPSSPPCASGGPKAEPEWAFFDNASMVMTSAGPVSPAAGPKGRVLVQVAVEAAALGADAELRDAIRTANTSQRALALAHAAGLPLGDRICVLARDRARAILPSTVAVEVWATDREGRPVGHAGFV